MYVCMYIYIYIYLIIYLFVYIFIYLHILYIYTKLRDNILEYLVKILFATSKK